MSANGPSELRAALARLRGGLAGVAMLSAVINVLAISSSIYMMLVYDRVLPGQSVATLASLFGIITVVYLFYGAFDVLRANMLSDIGAAVAQQLGPRVQALEMDLALRRPEEAARISPIRDLDGIRGFLASAGPAALIDLPWIVFFLAILTAMHIWLGVITLVGALLMACLTAITERITKRGVATLMLAANARAVVLAQQRRHVELVQGLGMRGRMAASWATADQRYLTAQTSLSERSATLGTIGRVFRIFLQSAVLSVGALLVIDGQASGGVIFASSILSGRALAPVDQAIANWRRFVDARQGWARLEALMRARPVATLPATRLPLPRKSLSVERLTLAPPGSTRITVADVSFTAEAGDAIAILGPSAAGKSSLLRGVIGVWAPARGEVRLDAARLDQWEPDTIGQAIGYMPQSVELFAGSVAANIARFEPDPPHDAVLAAAQSAGVHELILQLPNGYGTDIGEDGVHLSAGQRQRIGLARALYRDPFLVVLDEPNSNLDPDGDAALAGAIGSIRARGGIVLVATHRPSVFQAVNRIMVMRAGQMQGIGPRDEMLARLAGKAPPAPGAGFSVVANKG